MDVEHAVKNKDGTIDMYLFDLKKDWTEGDEQPYWTYDKLTIWRYQNESDFEGSRIEPTPAHHERAADLAVDYGDDG